MLAYLEGELKFQGEGWMVIFVGGFGYKVFPVGIDAVIGDKVALHLYDHIREDRHELFGFPDRDALSLFETMIDINGVGPKLAQKILNAGSISELRKRVLLGDVEYLSNLPGIGKKTAQKIVLEMKGVLVDDQPFTEDGDALEALIGLGYDRKEAAAVLATIEAETIEARVRGALRELSK